MAKKRNVTEPPTQQPTAVEPTTKKVKPIIQIHEAQNNLVNRLNEALYKKACLQAPTGYGKTIMALHA